MGTTKSKKAADKVKAEFNGRVAALVERIRNANKTKQVIGCYNGSQGNADCDAPEGSEEYQWAQHDHAIENVCLLLSDLRLLVDGDDERTVDRAFSEIS